MNVNKTMLGLKDVTGYPVVQDLYTGQETSYITFNYADEREVEFVDNDSTAEEVYMQVHLFVPLEFNYFAKKEAIRTYLKDASFSITDIQTFVETDTKIKIRHLVFECHKLERKG